MSESTCPPVGKVKNRPRKALPSGRTFFLQVGRIYVDRRCLFKKIKKYSLQAGTDAAEVVPERSGLSHDRRALGTVAQRTAFQLENETSDPSNATQSTTKHGGAREPAKLSAANKLGGRSPREGTTTATGQRAVYATFSG